MIIKFDNISIGYGEKIILKNLNFEFDSNESISLLGPNGIGKTTFFKSLLGFLPLLEGDILIDGVSIKKYKHKELAEIFSYVPQAKDYSYQFTVEEVIMMGRALYIKKFSSPSQEDYDVVNDILSKLNIIDYKDKIYSELSGGEQQIILIARALAQEAKFIIMDEPASNLDFSNQEKMLNTIKRLKDMSVGILMSTHTPDHAFVCSDKALVVKKNQSYIFGDVNNIVNSDILTEAYGVKIAVVENDICGKKIKTCTLVGRD